MASGSLWLAGRILLALAAALVISAVAAEAIGAKVQTSYSSEVPASGRTQAAALVVWSPTSAGTATVTLSGAEVAYYVKVRGDPMRLLAEAGSVGIKVKNDSLYHDFRAGVIVGQATLEADPFLITGLVVGAMQAGKVGESTNGSIREHMDSREGLLIIAVPAEGSDKVSYTLTYRVEGYERAGPYVVSVASVALAAAGFTLLVAYKRLNA